jgi:predicted SnoaL-like aldol condensation-catalyzing enzyme
MSARRKQRIRALLKAIETGDPDGIAVVDEARYIQHNPQTHAGSEGLAVLFARLAKSNPTVNLVRVFSDGDFVFAHTEYDFATRRIGFEVFRFEGDFTVEHWDNIQPRLGPNPGGRSMVDGVAEVDPAADTEQSRARVQQFVETVLIGGAHDRLAEFIAADLRQHHPTLVDGLTAFERWLTDGRVGYARLHRVLADKDFALAVCEGLRAGEHTAFYHLFRVVDDVLVEHWCTIEAVPAPETWKNSNGKF